MKTTDAEYKTWRDLLDNSPAKNNIYTKEKAEFIALTDAMKADVVNH